MAKTDSKVDEKDEIESEEVDEETQDESEDDDVENDTDDDTNDDDESDTEDSDDDTDEETDDEDDQSFKKKYTQIKGKTPEEYIPNLETAYKNSSAEAVRLKAQVGTLQTQIDNITALVANNPELAEKIKKGEAPQVQADPALIHARQQMEDQNKKEYSAFVDAHPELESDPELQKQVFDEISDFAQVALKKGRVLGMKEALTKAWTALGLKDDSKDEEIRIKAKDTAARGKNGGANKKSSSGKVTFTEAQINAGIQMGLGKTKQEVIKKLNQYATQFAKN